MTLRPKSFLKYLLSVLLTVVLLYFAFRNTDLEKLAIAIREANYWWMLAMFGTMMASHIFRAWRWRYLLDPIKPGTSFRNLFSGVMVGYFINNVLPRAGELVRPYSIGKLESLPKSAALGTIVVERIMDAVSFLILVMIIPLVYNGPLVEAFPWLQRAGVIISLGTFGFLLVAVVLMIRRDWTDVLLRVVTGFVSPSLARRIDGVVHSFLDGFLFIKRPGNFLAILILSILVWFLYVVMTYLAFFGFGLEGQLGFGAAVVVLAISSIGVAIPTPGATGGYHWFASQTLVRLFHVSNEVALSYATVTHAVGFIGVTIVGLYYFFHDNIRITDAMDKPKEEEG
jgi:glycosyltransferase 2 family protein